MSSNKLTQDEVDALISSVDTSAKAKAPMAKVEAEAKQINGEAITNKKTGIKVFSKLVRGPAATPLPLCLTSPGYVSMMEVRKVLSLPAHKTLTSL